MSLGFSVPGSPPLPQTHYSSAPHFSKLVNIKWHKTGDKNGHTPLEGTPAMPVWHSQATRWLQSCKETCRQTFAIGSFLSWIGRVMRLGPVTNSIPHCTSLFSGLGSRWLLSWHLSYLQHLPANVKTCASILMLGARGVGSRGQIESYLLVGFQKN